MTVGGDYRDGSAYGGKPRALSVGAGGHGCGGSWVGLCHAARRDGQETGRRHPPEEPRPFARLRWRRPARGSAGRVTRAAVGNPSHHRRPCAGARQGRSGARLCPGVSSVGGASPHGPPPSPGAESEARPHAPSGAAVVGRRGPRVHHCGSIPAPCRDSQRPVPCEMANGARDNTVAKRVGCGPVTRQSRPPVGGGLVAGAVAVCPGGGAASAWAAWGRLDAMGGGAARDVLAGVEAHPRGSACPHPRGGSRARGELGSVQEGHHGTTTPQKTPRPPRRRDRRVS